MEVHNYPMRSRSETELKELEEIKDQRQIEIKELAVKNWCFIILVLYNNIVSHFSA